MENQACHSYGLVGFDSTDGWVGCTFVLYWLFRISDGCRGLSLCNLFNAVVSRSTTKDDGFGGGGGLPVCVSWKACDSNDPLAPVFTLAFCVRVCSVFSTLCGAYDVIFYDRTPTVGPPEKTSTRLWQHHSRSRLPPL